MLFAQVAEGNHDLVWIAMIGMVQAIGLALFGLVGSLLAYFQWRQNRKLEDNTRLTLDTHRMVNGAFGAELDKTATAKEDLAQETGRPRDIAAAAVARKVSDDKAANVAAGSPVVTPEVPPPDSH